MKGVLQGKSNWDRGVSAIILKQHVNKMGQPCTRKTLQSVCIFAVLCAYSSITAITTLTQTLNEH
eukprot:scaffold3450_cov114-Cylindrotheca_fusiformis.AAC.14